MEPRDLMTYEIRRAKLAEVFEALGHGSRLDCALAIKMAPSYVSGILIGRIIDEDRLTTIEAWARARV